MTTKAQQWARKRNYAKRQFKGAKTILWNTKNILTDEEWQQLLDVLDLLDNVLFFWETNNAASKQTYLTEKD